MRCGSEGGVQVEAGSALLNHKKRQLSSAQLYLSSAAPCGAVRCHDLPCGAVLCRAELCFLSNIRYKYQVPACTYVLVFSLSSFECPRSILFMFFFLANYTRSADQNVASPTSTQDSTGQSALRKSSWHYRIACCT